MFTIDLKYGKRSIPVEYDASRFEILRSVAEKRAMTDSQIGELLDDPIDSPGLEEIIDTGQTILIVVPDATRQSGCGQVVNLLVRRLIANGTAAHDIRIIFATGIHRKVTDAEKQSILTPFIAQRIKALDHDPRDLAQLVRLGETSDGIPIELNRALTEHDHVIIMGGVTFHYFAGFTGGRKLICPGLASSRTIAETHRLAFDCETRSRREGVDIGLLDGNAVNEAFVEAVEKSPPSFAVNTIVNELGEITDLFCGNWLSSHRTACDAYSDRHTIRIKEKRGLVIASCGGHPFDINLIQAHKALEAASHACIDGGTIIFLAECPDGLGRDDFLKWFDAANSDALVETLCKKYQVNGQTAWSLLKKAERFDIKIITGLNEIAVQKMRLSKIDVSNIAAVTGVVGSTGYILPNAAKLRIS
jgi:lactate racemase